MRVVTAGTVLVEGTIDHHLLGIHHVRDMPYHVPAYDWMFLAVAGVGFLLIGWGLGASRSTTITPGL